MCRYCEGNVDDREFLDTLNNIYITGNNIITDDEKFDILIEYCPMCGKELK